MYKYAKTSSSVLLTVIFFLVSFQGFAQMSITGLTCVNQNSSATYTIAGSWTGSTTMNWSVVGGTITTASSGTPRPQVTISWGTFTGQKSVHVSTSNPTGSATLIVAFGPTLAGGTISNSSQTINYNTTAATINCSLPTGGACTPTYSYQWSWCSTSNGTYTNITGATSQNLTYATNLLATTYFQRKVTETVSSQSAFSTNYATVTVLPAINPGTISPNTISVNYNTSPGLLTGTAASGGNGSFTYQWTQSTDGTNWTNIAGATSLNYTPGPLTTTTYFSRNIGSNGVFATTPYCTVTVVQPTYGVTAPTNSTGNTDADMTWIKSTGFDPGGNILSQQKQFFDKSAQPIQTQTKVFYTHDPSTVYTHVFASETINDAYGRPVLSTIAAPIDYADFSYAPNFFVDANNSPYTYKNFDRFNPTGTETDKTNTPDAVGGQATRGTLGWYFGPNNIWEAYQATTNMPFSRKTVYRDGTNNEKKQGGLGEAFAMGNGHETSTFITPVSGELVNYLLVRNRFFTNSQIGGLPANLQGNAIVTTSKDANGSEMVNISDLGGKVLMSARPGTDLVATNNFGVAALPPTYSQQVNCTPGSNVTLESFTGGANVSIYLVNTTGVISLVYSGTTVGIPLFSSLGSGTLTLMSDVGFMVSYISSSSTYNNSSSTDLGGSVPSFSLFKVLTDNTAVTISGDYSLIDMNTETTTSLSAGHLNRGYYKIIANTGIVNLTYTNGFTDVTYNFHNQLGQLIASVPPNGVKLLENTGYTSYSTLASVPFINLYNYDVQGRMVNSTSPDGGTMQMIYRTDGKIRFSQNALQSVTGAYTYINYDVYGRDIETGQYSPGTGGITFNSVAMTGILDNVSATGGLTNGTQTDVILKTFDITDNSYGLPAYVQDPVNLIGAVSVAKRYSSVVNNIPISANLISETWYNYDEESKVTWTIKYIASLGANGYKTTEYFYDALGRLIKTEYQKNVPSETFLWWYQFDAASGNLVNIITNTQDAVQGMYLNAHYIYYLHGGIKRLELGSNVQGLDYTYTLDGRLKAINNSNNTTNVDPGQDAVAINGFGPDAFGEVIDYYNGDYNNSRPAVQPINGVASGGITSDNWIGNIKAMTWYTLKPAGSGGSNNPTTYLFTYDPKYQFLSSTWGTSINFGVTPATFTTTSFNQEKIVLPGTSTPAYDANGNILNLQRTDPAGLSTDQFSYIYSSNTNKLSTILNGPVGSQVTFANYTYDQLGRETFENTTSPSLNKYIQYDATGKVAMIANDALYTQPLVKYVYDETGQRIEKLSFNSSYQLVLVTYYFGDVIYTQTVTGGTTYGPLVPAEYKISGTSGKIAVYNRPSSTYVYELTDHLGNVRSVVAQISPNYQINSVFDYYPFGSVIHTYGALYRYGYQGKNSELDPETNWNNFELRMYNSRTARWSKTDPYGQFASPYNAMGNNPVTRIDQNGGESPIFDTDGNLLGTDDQGLQGQAIIMNTLNFKQGMDHETALSYNLGEDGLSSIAAHQAFEVNYNIILPSRPDYTGFMTYEQGIKWLQRGGGPVYLDASKYDLGNTNVNEFKKIGEPTLINFLYENTPKNTWYIFGNNFVTLLDDQGHVKLGNDKFDYDYHSGFDFVNIARSIGIAVTRWSNGINGDEGFKIYTYGVGQINSNPFPPVDPIGGLGVIP
jgi:RHS repeat-associated protein